MNLIGPSCIYQPSEWEIIEDGFNPEFADRNESIFAVGNGFLGARGFFEEGYGDNEIFGSVRSLYLNGYYDVSPIEYPESAYGFAKMHQSMVSVANPNSMKIKIGGERVIVAPSLQSNFNRTLDLRSGVLSRSFVWTHSNGSRFQLEFKRIASFSRYHLLSNYLSITALDKPAHVKVTSGLELELEKKVDESDPRVGGGDSSMGTKVRELHYEGGLLWLRQRAIRSFHDLHVAMTHSVRGVTLSEEERFVRKKMACVFEFDLEVGSPFELEKYTTYFHVREKLKQDLAALTRKECLEAKEAGFETVAREQAEYLHQFWQECDVEIDGDVALQQGIRFALFQLLQSVGRNGRSNVAAKGLTGEGYGGHYFWDTEIYVMPFFIWTKPEIAKALLHYRYTILNRARERAAEMNHKGALFPWRTISGDEASSFFPAGTAQYHINADIAFAVNKYVNVTGDESLLAEFGAEMLFEIARFFVDLGSWIEGKGYCIHCVTGPDEYTACVDNNAYTNTMVQKSLRAALKAKDIVKARFSEDWERIKRDLSLQEDEFAEWERCADGMYIPFNEQLGIVAQDDSFLSKPKWDFKKTPKAKYPLLLHYHYLNIYRHQVLKQADVLMLMYLAPEDYSQAITTRCFLYYEPLTTHDSSLSPAVHAAVAANIGRADFAYEYFDRTSRLDLDDIAGNTRDGLHIASLAGSWGALFYGFLGVQIRNDTLRFRPSIPTRWKRVKTRLQFRGRVVEVEVSPEEIQYKLISGADLPILHYHDEFVLTSEKPQVGPIAPYLRAVIFDLDGVITDTAEYHYLGWKKLADELGIPFDRDANENLKGVSRMASLDLILGERAKDYSAAEKEELAAKKNAYYRESLEQLDKSALLPGVEELLQQLRKAGIKTAIASSSKNARMILEQLGMTDQFDEIADGTEVLMSKPDPEVFLLAAKKLGVRPRDCIGVEDAAAGIESIRGADMIAVGVTHADDFEDADKNFSSLEKVGMADFVKIFKARYHRNDHAVNGSQVSAAA